MIGGESYSRNVCQIITWPKPKIYLEIRTGNSIGMV